MIQFYREKNLKTVEADGFRLEIPEEWEVVRLDGILSLEYGKGLPEKERTPGKYPVIGSNGIVGYHNKALVEGPGIIIGRKGTIGAVTWVEYDFWPIDTTYYVKTKRNDIDLRWLFYELTYLNPSRFELSDVVPGLKRELVYSMLTPIPPLQEQQKIAHVLMSIDKAIETIDEAIKQAERIKKGLMQELLTKGIGHKEFKDTEIGRIPKEWEVVRLGDVIGLKSGQYFKYSEFCESGVKCLKIDNVGFGKIIWDTITFLPKDYINKFPDLVLKEGDIVIALNRPILNNKIKVGRVKKEDSNSLLYQRVGKIVFKDISKIHNLYLFFVLLGDIFKNQLSVLLLELINLILEHRFFYE